MGVVRTTLLIAASAAAASSAPVVRLVPADHATVQLAVNASSDGDVVLVSPGVYGPITVDVAVTIASELWLLGDFSAIAVTVIDGGGSSAAVEVLAGSGLVELVGLTIRNASDGVSNHSPISVRHCVITDTSDGIDMESGADGSVVHACDIWGNSDDAIDYDGRSSGVVSWTTMRDNGNDGIEIRFPSSDDVIQQTYSFTDSLFLRNGEDGVQVIEHSGGSSNREVRIDRVLIQDSTDSGVGLMCCSVSKETNQGAALDERIGIYRSTIRGGTVGVAGGDNTIVVDTIFEGGGTGVRRLRVDSVVAWSDFWGNGTDLDDAITDVQVTSFDPILQADSTLSASSPAIDAGTATFVWLGETVLDVSDFSGPAPDLGAFEVGGVDLYNLPPFVTAGIDATTTTDRIVLTGLVADDSPVASLWSQIEGPGPVMFVDASSPTTEAQFGLPGTYTLELAASDGNGAARDRVVISVAGACSKCSAGSIDVRVSASSDDAEENGSGSMSLTSSDLELVRDGDDQTIGMRFLGIDISQGVAVTRASLQFTVDETDSEPTDLVIQAQADDDPGTFTSTRFDISDRLSSSAQVAWSVPAWEETELAGPDQQTPDLTVVIQELIDRPGWVSGNALVLIITGTGKRTAESYDGVQEAAPLLHVEFGSAPLAVCGDDIREGDEVCDGTDLDGQTCVSLGFDSGDLACLADCSGFDTTGCISACPELLRELIALRGYRGF